ncbi:MAG: HD domain-containing protein [Cyclobacteriaceae bacterium]
MAEQKKFETKLTKKAEAYVRDFLEENFSEKICYHNLNHTLEVVEAAEIIGRGSGLNTDELEIVTLAAWFHDIGYYIGKENHEAESAKIAEKYLSTIKCSQKVIQAVAGCIHATKIPQSPVNLVEEVLCDADLYHLSTEKFFEKTELLREEMLAHEVDINREKWLSTSCHFVTNHTYFTDFARAHLRPKKIENLAMLREKIGENKL